MSGMFTCFFDLGKCLHGLHRGRGYSHQVRPCVHTALYLDNCGINIASVGVGHALYADGSVATDGDIANHDLASGTAFDGAVMAHDDPLIVGLGWLCCFGYARPSEWGVD